jgi:hypothetical protein
VVSGPPEAAVDARNHQATALVRATGVGTSHTHGIEHLLAGIDL